MIQFCAVAFLAQFAPLGIFATTGDVADHWLMSQALELFSVFKAILLAHVYEGPAEQVPTDIAPVSAAKASTAFAWVATARAIMVWSGVIINSELEAITSILAEFVSTTEASLIAIDPELVRALRWQRGYSMLA